MWARKLGEEDDALMRALPLPPSRAHRSKGGLPGIVAEHRWWLA